MSGGRGGEERSAQRYSAKPKWLLESYSALAKFQETSEQVRESFEELQVSFGDFDDKAEAAKVMDREHATRLREGPAKGPSAAQRHVMAGKEAKRHPWVALPCEIHGEILLFLDIFAVDQLLQVGNQLRIALLSVDEVWKPWCVSRWGISGVDKSRSSRHGGGGDGERPRVGSWLRTCSTRASVLRPALVLCAQGPMRRAGEPKHCKRQPPRPWVRAAPRAPPSPLSPRRLNLPRRFAHFPACPPARYRFQVGRGARAPAGRDDGQPAGGGALLRVGAQLP